MLKLLSLCLFISMISPQLKADVLNEGWYKVMSANVHIGFYVVRYEYDPKKRQFTSKSFLKTNPAGGDITESLVAVSDEGMKPVSYQYTSLNKKDGATTIDAKFSNNKISLVSSIKGVKKTETRDIKKGSFLSAHLPLMLIKKGVEVGKNFGYTAIAEEEGKTHEGKSFIKETKKLGTKDLYRILNTFKGTKFVSLMDKNGQIIATKAPLLGLTTNLEKDSKTAAGNISIPKKSLKKIFGSLP